VIHFVRIEDDRLPARTRDMLTTLRPMLLASMLALSVGAARADEPVTLSLTIKDHRFEPAEVHAPAAKPIIFAVKNLGSGAAEFESGALHFEKVIAAGGQALVHVPPQQPGRYKFFDDFHRATEGSLVVP